MRARSHRFDRRGGWEPSLPTTPDGSADLVFVFGAASYADQHAPFEALAGAFPAAAIVGCSTSGEIHGDVVEDETLAVAVVDFDRTPVKVAAVPISRDDSEVTGTKLGAELAGEPSLAAVVVLSDGLDVNGSALVEGIDAAVDEGTKVVGGLAGDGDRFESTWVLVDGIPTSGYVVGVGLYGDSIRVGHGSKGGWDIFGRERLVTRSDRNILYELDGRPALELYKEYLGEFADGLPATGLLFPLALRRRGEGDQLVRTILAVDEAAGSLTFAGDVPEGHIAQLMQANFDRLIDGAEEAAGDAFEFGSERPTLCLAISCVGRRLVLGERTENELEAVRHVLPDDTVQVGFYSYGEISPHRMRSCDLHNQTMTLTTFAEV